VDGSVREGIKQQRPELEQMKKEVQPESPGLGKGGWKWRVG
jgi:hypothetical protein